MRPLPSKILITALFLLSASCGTEEPQDSDEQFLTGAGPSRGHEDLTRFGADFADTRLQQLIGQRPYPEIQKGVAGLSSDDPLIRGNYETDFPTDKMRAFHNVSPTADWHHDSTLQYIHSLRGTDGGDYRSNRNTCLFHQKMIRKASEAALNNLRAGNRNEGLYWLGHASHMIQDSFSEAHTSRGGNGGRAILDFCIYGADVPGICHHETVDVRDSVWQTSPSCLADPSNRSWACLKDNAKWAAEATGAYLTTMGRLAFGGETDFDGLLDDFFHNEADAGLGYFNCNSLPETKVGIHQITVNSSKNPFASCQGTWRSAGPDLNDGAGGKFLELCYKGADSATPIDALAVAMGKNASCPAGMERIDQDLNEGARGEYIYLCVGHGSGRPLQNIKVTSSKNQGNSCGNGWNWIDADLNKGASGKFIYICYK